MTLIELECPSCGAPASDDARRCDYCGARFRSAGPAAPAASAAQRETPPGPSLLRLAPGEGEFGAGTVGLAAGLAVAGLVYLVGWRYEDPVYWLDPRAITIWGVVLPLWLALVALSLRLASGLLPGVTFAAAILVSHLMIMARVDGGLNDDDVGISAAYAGGALAAWLTGRLLHRWVRVRRLRSAAPPHRPEEELE